MRKLAEIKGDDALDVLAEILVPITTITNDDEVKAGFETNVAQSVSIALKKHKKEVEDIMSAVGGKPWDELKEEVTLMTLPATMYEILSDPVVQSLFR